MPAGWQFLTPITAQDRVSRRSRAPFWIHAGLVAVGLMAFAWVEASSSPEDGANIGAGLVGLPLLLVGLPWSLPIFVNPYRFDDMTNATRWAVYFGPAVLNVALHGLYRCSPGFHALVLKLRGGRRRASGWRGRRW